MWSDNETKVDLLGFKVHSDLIREVVTDSALLPVVLGVFGDWGGGKSSIMQMLQADLETENSADVACLYFNGWMFEGYEDAKTALLSTILLELGEHKRFGPKIQDDVVILLKRVQWMEVGRLAVKHVGVPLLAGVMTGGTATIPTFLASLVHKPHEQPEKLGTEKSTEDKTKKEEKNWMEHIVSHPAKPDVLEIRKFRNDFEKMLAKTNIRSLVILIDDLDRCLPDRIIDTLEAIKLFVAVPKTAFVIGADPRIVRHAIATRYAKQIAADTADESEQYDIVKDYLEKLIQIPYHLPRLSPAEMETYINLLLCQRHLPEGDATALISQLAARRQESFYTALSYGDIRETLGGGPLEEGLERQLAWSNAVAVALTEGLKGNPRQVKRMLNAMILRTKLANIAKLPIRADVLAKLMVLEYTQPEKFKDLDSWQTATQGFPPQMQQLEQAVQDDEDNLRLADQGLEEWTKPKLRRWLTMNPALSTVDLRDYFWIARDRTKSTLAEASMVSPLVRRIYSQLIDENRGEQMVAVGAAKELIETEQDALFGLLGQLIKRHADQDAGPAAFRLLATSGVRGAAPAFLAALVNIPVSKATPSIAPELAAIAQAVPELKPQIVIILEDFRIQSSTRLGRSAATELEGLH